MSVTSYRKRQRASLVGLVVGLSTALFADALYAEDLQQVYERAQAQDPQLAAVEAQYRATTEGVPQARAAAFLPNATINAEASLNRQDITSQFGRGGVSTFNNYQYALTVNQPVYHPDRWIAVKQADRRIAQALAQLAAARQELIVRTAERYLDVLYAQDSLSFAQAEVAALGRQLDQAQARFKVGLVAITDLQEAQAGRDLAQARVIEATNALDNAREALGEVTGRVGESLAPVGNTVPFITPEPADLERWQETALAQNREIAAAALAADVAKDDIRRQFSGHLPSLDVVGSYGVSSRGGQFAADSESGSIGLQLTVPLYAGGSVNSRTREAEHRYQQTLDQLEQQRRETHRQTHDAYLGVVTGISRVQALMQAVSSNETAVAAAQAGTAVGTRTAVDVVVAQRALAQAQRDWARARYDYLLNHLRLKRAAGTLAPEDVQRVTGWLQH